MESTPGWSGEDRGRTLAAAAFKELEDAKASVEVLTPIFKEFVADHLSETFFPRRWFSPTVFTLISVDSLRVVGVDTPFPPNRNQGSVREINLDRDLEMSICVSAECTVLGRNDLSLGCSFDRYVA